MIHAESRDRRNRLGDRRTLVFDKVPWDVVGTRSGATASITQRYVSPDNDMGYTGTLTTLATCPLDEQDQLTIAYRAATDKPTLVNISNHASWNLGRARSPDGAMRHVVTIPAERYTRTDATSIPTSELPKVAGTVLDFRTPHAVGERVRDKRDRQTAFGRGDDHIWVDGHKVTAQPHSMARSSHLCLVAASSCDRTSRGCASIRAISWTAPWSARATASIAWVTRL